MCGQTTLDQCLEYHESGLRYARKPREGGHAPAVVDTRFPRMGGKPNPGTKKDKRLKRNKKGGKK